MFASEHVAWTSSYANDTDAPRHWGDIQDGYIRLRDDRTDTWPNALVSPNTFWFFYPSVPCPERPWEHTIVRHMEACIINNSTPLVVHLFVSGQRGVEFYGVWTAVTYQCVGDGKMMLTLRRNLKQLVSYTRPPMSTPLHVRVHEHYIRRNIDVDWSLCCETNRHPSVVHGKRYHPGAFRGDMVLTHGRERVCVVSLPCIEALTPEEKRRCALIQQRMSCRVVVVGGIPPLLVWSGLEPGGVWRSFNSQHVEWLKGIDTAVQS